jgi:oligoribonuclease (3'-5' exoribonuclease)
MLISLDTETTGTDLERHEIWEVALVLSDGDYLEYQFPVDLANADPNALQINDFYERFYVRPWSDKVLREQALGIARYTAKATLMGCAIGFDMKFLDKLLRKYHVGPAWSHRALDLGSYAAARVGAPLPLSSREMAENVANDASHTALGDAQWNWSVYHWYRRHVHPVETVDGGRK